MNPNPFSLEGRTALVTGSSSGIGQAVAAAIQAAGAKVIRHGIESEDPDPSSSSTYLAADLLAEDGPEKLLEAAFQLSPDLDLLVCNAGNNHNAPFLEMTRKRWDLTMDLNLKANYFAAQAFAKKLAAEQRLGAIVVTGSINGFQAEINSSAYDISKGGCEMMVRGLAMELADYNIRVNGIAPGLIFTPKTRVGFGRNPKRQAHFENKILKGRIGEPRDCTGTVVFLLSEASEYITGEMIVVDGGLTVGQVGKME